MRAFLTLAALAALGVHPSLGLGQADTGAAPAATDAAAGKLLIDLNKLQQVDKRCDSYFEVKNGTGTNIEELTLKAYLFDSDGIIIVAPVIYPFLELPAGKSKVQMFSLDDLKCDSIHRWLINEVVACTAAEAPVEGCADLIATSSKAAAVTLEY
jgi:hypothetical protein